MGTSQFWKRASWWAFVASGTMGIGAFALIMTHPFLPAAWTETVILVGASLFFAAWVPFIFALVASIAADILSHRELMRRIHLEASEAAQQELRQQSEERN